MSDKRYAIREDDMAAIADAARWRTGRLDAMTISGMVEEMKRQYFVNRTTEVVVEPYEEPWTRPADWPDLDSLGLEMAGDDYIVMTYDANREASAIAWHIETADGQPATLEIGHIEGGAYIADETYSVANNANFVRWTDDLSGYLVLRVTGQIAACYGYSVTRDGQTQHFRQQPILERVAWVPHLTAFCTHYGTNAWTMYSLEREAVANGDGGNLKSLYYAWAYGYALRELDISGLRTTKATNFNAAFVQCEQLTELDLRHFETSLATNMASVFSNCRALRRIDLRGWNTGEATNFSGMFQECNSLTEIAGLDGFDTAKATNLGNLFNNCRSLLDVSPAERFATGNVTNFGSIFSNCWQVTALDLSGWDTGKATAFNSLFYGCANLRSLNLTGWTHDVLTTVSSMFYDCQSLQKIDVSWLHLTDACTNIYGMFYNCRSVTELTIPPDWDLSGLNNANNVANSVFANCNSLIRITGIANWQFHMTNSIVSMFDGDFSLQEVDVSGWKTDTVTNMGNMFRYCYSLKRVDLSGWKTDNCTNISGMFQSCNSLADTGDISGWNTAKVTTMASMFQDCYSLTRFPDISKWDYSAVTTLASMFSSCLSPTEVEWTDLSLPQCTTIATMFRYCRNLRRVKLTGWSLPKLNTAPGAIFADCDNLRDVEMFEIPLNHSYNNDVSLTHESLISILDSLPRVSAARTLNLTTQNINRLTAEEKKIATDKGWTLAN